MSALTKEAASQIKGTVSTFKAIRIGYDPNSRTVTVAKNLYFVTFIIQSVIKGTADYAAVSLFLTWKL